MLIFWDTEYTCWPGSIDHFMTEEGQDTEVFQIGAIKINPENGWEEVATFDMLAHPTKNPILSDYAQKLTGISQNELDARGEAFPFVAEKFAEFCGDTLPLFSYGEDERVLATTCRANNIRLPISTKRCNDIRLLFERAGVSTAGYTSGTIHRAVGIDMGGHVHNALHDCRSMAAVAKFLAQKKSYLLAS